MTRQIVLRHPSSVHRRQPLLESNKSPSSLSTGSGSKRLGEVAGGTAAECAAVWCCCPCAVLNLLVLAVYKLPAGLCRKVLQRKRRRRMLKKGSLPSQQQRRDSSAEMWESAGGEMSPTAVKSLQCDNDVMIQLEKEMWDRFHSTGFWRSSSQRYDQ